jgi:hypothetical protein
LFKMALDGIFSAVAYRYATAHYTTTFFDEELLGRCFAARPSWFARTMRRFFRIGRHKELPPVSGQM